MTGWQLAIAEIAAVAREAVAVRDAGFTTDAFNYPRADDELKLLCAFNGIRPEQAPRGWRYYPNAGMMKAWQRVTEAARAL